MSFDHRLKNSDSEAFFRKGYRVNIKHSEWREHWKSVVAASIGVATGFSMLQYGSSVFIQPWQDAFGWSRGEIALAHNGMILAALLSPVGGALIDRLGVRKILLSAMVLTGSAYLAMSQLNGSLTQFYVTYLFLQVVGIFTTGLAFTRVVASRFHHSRGLALACTRIGISLFGFILIPALHALIAAEGWQAGFFLLSAIVFGVGLPICYFGIHDLTESDTAGPAQHDHTSFLSLLKGDRRVLLLCTAAGLGYAPLSALLSQFQPLLTGKGIEPQSAATLTGVLAASVLIGTMVSGFLIDRIWAPLVACIFTLAPIVGCFLLYADTPTMAVATLSAILIGIAQGAEIDIVAYLSAR
ncbi:MAG: MFS transporter, partial [Sphingomonadaceae bacterium]